LTSPFGFLQLNAFCGLLPLLGLIFKDPLHVGHPVAFGPQARLFVPLSSQLLIPVVLSR
jgi:hypothetical protein